MSQVISYLDIMSADIYSIHDRTSLLFIANYSNALGAFPDIDICITKKFNYISIKFA